MSNLNRHCSGLGLGGGRRDDGIDVDLTEDVVVVIVSERSSIGLLFHDNWLPRVLLSTGERGSRIAGRTTTYREQAEGVNSLVAGGAQRTAQLTPDGGLASLILAANLLRGAHCGQQCTGVDAGCAATPEKMRDSTVWLE